MTASGDTVSLLSTSDLMHMTLSNERLPTLLRGYRASGEGIKQDFEDSASIKSTVKFPYKQAILN